MYFFYKKYEKIKNTFILFLALYIILYPSCVWCEEEWEHSINHAWTLTEGYELNSNGYYLDYTDAMVTTSTNEVVFTAGDDC